MEHFNRGNKKVYYFSNKTILMPSNIVEFRGKKTKFVNGNAKSILQTNIKSKYGNIKPKYEK